MVGSDDFIRQGGAATTLLKGIGLATVQKIEGPDRPRTAAIDSGYSSNSDQDG
jgi:hypothetical protein